MEIGAGSGCHPAAKDSGTDVPTPQGHRTTESRVTSPAPSHTYVHTWIDTHTDIHIVLFMSGRMVCVLAPKLHYLST